MRRGIDGETLARRRAFKEAMRQRIQDIAASRDLSGEEIKAVLRLKHHEIANFAARIEGKLTSKSQSHIRAV